MGHVISSNVEYKIEDAGVERHGGIDISDEVSGDGHSLSAENG